MLKLKGSRRVIIQCSECPETSEPFDVTLADDDWDGYIWFPRSYYPDSWKVPEEAGLYEDVIYGHCPKHNEMGIG